MNLSMPRDAALAAGGYTVFPDPIYYEDLELAFRLARTAGMPVVFRPEAVAFHDHRYEPAGYLAREEVLGRTAFGVAQRSPEFARALFGRDITSPDEIAIAREYVERERTLADRLREAFIRTASMTVGAQDLFDTPGIEYERHLPLKRWHWRVGLLRGVDGVRHDDAQRAAHAGGCPSTAMAEKIAPQGAAVHPIAGR
jgi:hypothetical protein